MQIINTRTTEYIQLLFQMCEFVNVMRVYADS